MMGGKISGIFLLCIMTVWVQAVFAAEEKMPVKKTQPKKINVSEIPGAIANTDLTREAIPSPHWKKDDCDICHQGENKPSSKNLRISNVDKLCSTCHDGRFDHSYIHPIAVKPKKDMLRKMNKHYKQVLKKTDGRIGCISCHDIAVQCKAEQSGQRLTNPKFFRLGPFKSRSQPCYFCHDKKQYQRLNPHDQVDNKGNIKKAKCRICHASSYQELSQAKNIRDVRFNADDDNLSSMCWGCHIWTPHPGGQFSFFKSSKGPNHLIKPPAYILSAIKKTEEQKNIILPREPATGKIFCGTCHNPHEKGVIKNVKAAKGADSRRRLRTENICHSCHDK